MHKSIWNDTVIGRPVSVADERDYEETMERKALYTERSETQQLQRSGGALSWLAGGRPWLSAVGGGFQSECVEAAFQ